MCYPPSRWLTEGFIGHQRGERRAQGGAGVGGKTPLENDIRIPHKDEQLISTGDFEKGDDTKSMDVFLTLCSCEKTLHILLY